MPDEPPPCWPTAMDEVDAVGAEAVATYFAGLFPYAHATGDVAELAALSHPECIFCASVLDGVGALDERGERVVGGTATWADVTSIEVDTDRWWLVTFTLNEQASQTVDTAGGLVAESEAKDYRVDAAVIREGDAWLIREFTPTVLTDAP